MNWSPGDLLPTLNQNAFTQEDLKIYAVASQDHNPIHLDDSFAKEAGFPSVIVHGMLLMSLLGDYIRQHFPEGKYTLKRFSTRFKKVTFPGDILIAEGKVRAVQADGTLILNVWLTNQRDEIPTDAEAEVIPCS